MYVWSRYDKSCVCVQTDPCKSVSCGMWSGQGWAGEFELRKLGQGGGVWEEKLLVGSPWGNSGCAAVVEGVVCCVGPGRGGARGPCTLQHYIRAVVYNILLLTQYILGIKHWKEGF